MEAPRRGAAWHFGRSFVGTRLEDTCPCPKEPCGLVSTERVNPNCPEHPFTRAKTIRQSHTAENCRPREESPHE